jgi:hypothetical protein
MIECSVSRHRVDDDRSGRPQSTIWAPNPRMFGKRTGHINALAQQRPGIDYATVLGRLYDSLGMKLDHLRWIPRQLTDHLRTARAEECRKLLTALEPWQPQKFRTRVTGDACYFIWNTIMR